MDWGFIWIMFVLKIPLVALLWICWWAIRAVPEAEESAAEDSGQGPDHDPRPRRPRPPRRGPHAEPPHRSPERIRAGVRTTSGSPK